jgi:uncharacterized metal-binding protein
MPNYKTHDLACYTIAPIISVASLTQISLKESLLLCTGILLSNYYLSPDLDINSVMNKRWGILNFMWIPYKKLFSHRSFFTHSGPISATIRLIYLCIILAPLLFVVSYYDVVYYAHIYQRELLVLYVACVVSDTLHTGLDYLHHVSKIPFSFWKNTRKHHRSA